MDASSYDTMLYNVAISTSITYHLTANPNLHYVLCKTDTCSDFPPLVITLRGSEDSSNDDFTVTLESKYFLQRYSSGTYYVNIMRITEDIRVSSVSG